MSWWPTGKLLCWRGLCCLVICIYLHVLYITVTAFQRFRRRGSSWILHFSLCFALSLPGLKAGDEILLLNGKPASALQMDDMRAAFVNQALTLSVSTLPQLDPLVLCALPPRRSEGEQDASTDIFSQSQGTASCSASTRLYMWSFIRWYFQTVSSSDVMLERSKQNPLDQNLKLQSALLLSSLVFIHVFFVVCHHTPDILSPKKVRMQMVIFWSRGWIGRSANYAWMLSANQPAGSRQLSSDLLLFICARTPFVFLINWVLQCTVWHAGIVYTGTQSSMNINMNPSAARSCHCVGYAIRKGSDEE